MIRLLVFICQGAGGESSTGRPARKTLTSRPALQVFFILLTHRAQCAKRAIGRIIPRLKILALIIQQRSQTMGVVRASSLLHPQNDHHRLDVILLTGSKVLDAVDSLLAAFL